MIYPTNENVEYRYPLIIGSHRITDIFVNKKGVIKLRISVNMEPNHIFFQESRDIKWKNKNADRLSSLNGIFSAITNANLSNHWYYSYIVIKHALLRNNAAENQMHFNIFIRNEMIRCLKSIRF